MSLPRQRFQNWVAPDYVYAFGYPHRLSHQCWFLDWHLWVGTTGPTFSFFEPGLGKVKGWIDTVDYLSPNDAIVSGCGRGQPLQAGRAAIQTPMSRSALRPRSTRSDTARVPSS